MINKYKGELLVFTGGALWGLAGPFISVLESYGSYPALTSFLRIGFAFIILFIITSVKYGFSSFKIPVKSLITCALLGIICHGIYNICYCLAVTNAGIAIGSVLLYTAPVFTAISSYIFFKEKITSKKAIALLINIIGCSFAATGGNISLETLSVTGIVFGLCSGLAYSFSAIIGKLASDNTNAFVMTTYTFLFASIFLFFFAKPWTSEGISDIKFLAVAFLYALIPTALGYVIYYAGLREITETSRVPVITSVEMIVASLMGIVVFHEAANLITIIGILLVIMSIVIINAKSKSTT